MGQSLSNCDSTTVYGQCSALFGGAVASHDRQTTTRKPRSRLVIGQIGTGLLSDFMCRSQPRGRSVAPSRDLWRVSADFRTFSGDFAGVVSWCWAEGAAIAAKSGWRQYLPQQPRSVDCQKSPLWLITLFDPKCIQFRVPQLELQTHMLSLIELHLVSGLPVDAGPCAALSQRNTFAGGVG